MDFESGDKVIVLCKIDATFFVDGSAYMEFYDIEIEKGQTFIFKGPQFGSFEFSL